MKLTFAYCRDKDGELYLNLSSKTISKGKTTWESATPWPSWVLLTEHEDGSISCSNEHPWFPFVNDIDFSEIPVPKWEDESPIFITLNYEKISQTYYTEG